MQTAKTPSSLKWLITKKARLMGQISKLEATIPGYLKKTEVALHKTERKAKYLRSEYENSLATLEKVLPKLKEQLKAIDIALGIHEIQINPELIQPVVPHDSQFRFPYGSISRGIFECLRLSGRPTDTMEVAAFIAKKFMVDETKVSMAKVSIMVSKRLKILANEGKVLRLHPKKRTAQRGMWTLPPRAPNLFT